MLKFPHALHSLSKGDLAAFVMHCEHLAMDMMLMLRLLFLYSLMLLLLL